MRRSAVLLLACLYTSGSGSEDAEQKQLRIALHAQAAPSADRIVGSVMTTNGLKRALLRTGSVEHAASLYPFHYEKLESAAWDVLIIEGWFEVISVLIHEFRRKRPGAIVLFWCLDPAFPGLDAIVSIDVDGYLTNSKPVAEALGAFAPTRLVLLAADMDEMSAAPGPAPAGAAAADGAASRRKLVYVGSALGIETKTNLVPMLREAAASPAGLELWGSGWGAVGPADLAVHWRGVLPGALLAKTYAGALAVLGATMDGQRDAGMLNNRVFEALATGAPLIQEHFPELETLFATDANSTAAPLDNLLLWGGPGDMAEFVDKLERRTLDESTEASARAQKRISDDHTYDARAAQVLAFINELAAAKALAALQDPYGSCQRSGCLRVAVVWDAGHLGTSPEFATSFLAAADLLKRDYALGWHDARAAETSAQLLAYDVVVAVGGLGGAADAVVSRLTRDYTTFRRVTQRRVLVLFDEPRAVDDAAALSAGRDARPPEAVYDAACYAAEHDRRRLEALGFAPLGLQHAYGVSLPPPSGDDVVVDARGLVLARDVNDVDLIVLAARAALDGGADRVVVALIAEIVRVSQISRLRRRLRAEFEGRPVLLRLLGLDGVAAVADMVRRANVIMIVAAEPTGVPDGRAFTTGGGECCLAASFESDPSIREPLSRSDRRENAGGASSSRRGTCKPTPASAPCESLDDRCGVSFCELCTCDPAIASRVRPEPSQLRRQNQVSAGAGRTTSG